MHRNSNEVLSNQYSIREKATKLSLKKFRESNVFPKEVNKELI